MRLKLVRPLVLFDIESTGTSVSKDYIVEIAFIKMLPDGTETKYKRLIKPPVPIPESASKVHGITDKDVENEPSFANVAKSLFSIIDGCDVGGFINIHFDVPLLYLEFHRAGIKWNVRDINVIDAGVIFKRKEERTLAAAVKFYLGKEIKDAHTADADIDYTKDVLIAQLDRYEDVPCDSIEELALFCNYDMPRLDVSGKFKMDEYGNIIINFGTNKGKKAVDELGFIQWMIHPSRDFLPDTLDICHDILREHNPKYNDVPAKKQDDKTNNNYLFR